MTIRALTLLVVLMATPASAAEELSGPARVIDAVTMEISGEPVRLYGIVAPAPGVRCAIREVTVDCGHVAATALMDLSVATTVHCRVLDADATPQIAKCTAGEYDLSEGMVYTGWARPTADAPERLHRVEETARSRGRGLWLNGFPPAVNAAIEGNNE